MSKKLIGKRRGRSHSHNVKIGPARRRRRSKISAGNSASISSRHWGELDRRPYNDN